MPSTFLPLFAVIRLTWSDAVIFIAYGPSLPPYTSSAATLWIPPCLHLHYPHTIVSLASRNHYANAH